MTLRTRAEAAEFFRCSVETFDRRMRSQLPAPKMVGSSPRWLQAWLDDWAAARDELAAPGVRARPQVAPAALSAGLTPEQRAKAEEMRAWLRATPRGTA